MSDRIKDLEHEGDIAADYLEVLLDIADLDGDIDMDVENDRAVVSIVGAELDLLVGPKGDVLDALQELTSRDGGIANIEVDRKVLFDLGNDFRRQLACDEGRRFHC